MSKESSPLARPGSPRELFIAFTLLALQGFGGVLTVAQRVLCELRPDVSDAAPLPNAPPRAGEGKGGA